METPYNILSILWFVISILGVVKGDPLSEYGVALALSALFDILASIERYERKLAERWR